MQVHLSTSMVDAGLIFLSGQMGLDSNSRALAGGVSVQTRGALERLEAVLKEHQLGREAIIKTTVWLTAAEDFPEFDQEYARFFGDHKPARSTTVAALVVPGALVEIEAIARHPEGGL